MTNYSSLSSIHASTEITVSHFVLNLFVAHALPIALEYASVLSVTKYTPNIYLFSFVHLFC